MPDLTPEVPSALSPLVRRVVANNTSLMTGPGTNTYQLLGGTAPTGAPYILKTVGKSPNRYLGSGTWALLTIVVAEVWRGLGFWTLYYLASLQNIPEELLDAARVDGARGFRRFRRITVPLLRPMLLFAVDAGLELRGLCTDRRDLLPIRETFGERRHARDPNDP